MESHEVLKEALRKTSPKAVAAELGVSLSLVYKWAEKPTADGSGSRNPLDRILEITPGHVRCEAGIRISRLDDAAGETGQELLMYPSTRRIATSSPVLCAMTPAKPVSAARASSPRPATRASSICVL